MDKVEPRTCPLSQAGMAPGKPLATHSGINYYKEQIMTSDDRKSTDWALTSTQNRRQNIDTLDQGKRYRFRYSHGTEAGFGTALHHHVSRSNMSAIANYFISSQQSVQSITKKSDQQALQDALGGFNSIVTKIARDAQLQTQDLEKILHNLPLNLHYGPSIVKDDPGESFDPSTCPKPNTDGERQLEPTSAALQLFVDTYQTAVDALLNVDSTLTAATWTDLTKHLTAAWECYQTDKNLVNGISLSDEQWIQSSDTDTWAKRGMNTWPSLETAKKLFESRPKPLPVGADGTTLAASRTFRLQNINIQVGYTKSSLIHFCNRHTYLHFNLHETKLINSFFPVGTDQNAVMQEAIRAFALIEAELKRHLLPTDKEGYGVSEDLTNLLADDGLTFRAGNLLICVINVVNTDAWNGDVENHVEMTMMSPTGPIYESYDEQLLKKLTWYP
jgi:hypothetical protein